MATRKLQPPLSWPDPLRVALRESINLVSIRLLQEVGIPQTIETAIRFGFDREQLPGTLSLALGSGWATPLKMAEAYAVFANGGFAVKPYLIERIEDHNGKILFQADPESVCSGLPRNVHTKYHRASTQSYFRESQLFDEQLVKGCRSTRHRYARKTQLGRNDLAGKTGTTNDQRDAWFNGFSNGIVASTWLGFDNSSPLGRGETGGKAALPMWIEFMKTALHDVPENPLTPPAGIVEAYINPEDGLLLNQKNKKGIWEYFSDETVPTTFSTPLKQSSPLRRKTIPKNHCSSHKRLVLTRTAAIQSTGGHRKSGKNPYFPNFLRNLSTLPGSIHHSLFACIKRMTRRANFYIQIFRQYRSGLKGISTPTGNSNLFIFRMNFRFHSAHIPLPGNFNGI